MLLDATASDDFNARGDMCDSLVLKLKSHHGAKKRTPSKQNDLNMYYDHPSEDDALYGVAGRRAACESSFRTCQRRSGDDNESRLYAVEPGRFS